MCAQSACKQSPPANKILLPIHPRNFGGHVTVHPTILPALQGNQCKISGFLARQFGSLQLDIAHPCCGQLTAVKTRYPLTSITRPYCRLRYRTIEVRFFFLSYPLISYQFSSNGRLYSKWISFLLFMGGSLLALGKSLCCRPILSLV